MNPRPSKRFRLESDSDTYGARKALCEQAAEQVMPGQVLKVRPGIIVGPHEQNGRFLYWVRRAANGGEMLAPGKPEASVQLIDVRDLADWMIRMAELGVVATYNATGPTSPLTFGQMLGQCIAATGGNTRITWVDDQFLLDRGVAPFSDLPFLLPMEAYKGHFAVSCRRAIEAGVTFRPLAETVTDTLQWRRAAGVNHTTGITPAREQELLTAWHENIQQKSLSS
jgi:2'-hydroxyisoflavone reductase